MKKPRGHRHWFWGLLGAGLAILIAAYFRFSPPSSSPVGVLPVPSVTSTQLPGSKKTPEFKVHTLPHSTVYTLMIPVQSQFLVHPALSATVSTLEEFARQHGAIAALNGGFFDPENQKSTSSVILQRSQVAKPEDDERLMTNPALLPYLDRILNRSEVRQYRCGEEIRYDIGLRQELPTVGCEFENALGAGPRLLPEMTLEQEGFRDVQNGRIIRDPLGSDRRNARSAVGIAPDGSITWVMVAQKPNAPGNSGMTLRELADFMRILKLEQAMNLDGGSSSALYYGGETLYGKVTESGQRVQRSVKSALLVLKTTQP